MKGIILCFSVLLCVGCGSSRNSTKSETISTPKSPVMQDKSSIPPEIPEV
ncbi:MAG: hypothetical protein L3J43_09710 [Sulfurovum sp.]|nr:hypothetical protein [Sulfurovum sp.]